MLFQPKARQTATGLHKLGTLSPRGSQGPQTWTCALANSLALSPAGVLLHVMGDALGSVVVVITAIIFYVRPLREEDPCNWQCYIDPSLTVAMVMIILSSAFPLIKETAIILLQMVPKGVNMEELSKSGESGLEPPHTSHLLGQRASVAAEQGLLQASRPSHPRRKRTPHHRSGA